MTDEREEDNRPGPTRLMTVKVALRLENDVVLEPGEPLVLLYYSRAWRVAQVRRASDGREFSVPVTVLKYLRGR